MHRTAARFGVIEREKKDQNMHGIEARFGLARIERKKKNQNMHRIEARARGNRNLVNARACLRARFYQHLDLVSFSLAFGLVRAYLPARM